MITLTAMMRKVETQKIDHFLSLFFEITRMSSLPL